MPLYRCWLFQQKSHLSTKEKEAKRKHLTIITTLAFVFC